MVQRYQRLREPVLSMTPTKAFICEPPNPNALPAGEATIPNLFQRGILSMPRILIPTEESICPGTVFDWSSDAFLPPESRGPLPPLLACAGVVGELPAKKPRACQGWWRDPGLARVVGGVTPTSGVTLTGGVIPPVADPSRQ